MDLAHWLQTRDRTPSSAHFDDITEEEDGSLWGTELPDADELSDDWGESVTPTYSTILEAEEVEDSSASTLADTITAGILVTQWLFDRSQAEYLKPRTRQPLDQREMELLLSDRVSDTKAKLDRISREYQRTGNSSQWYKQAETEVRKAHTEAYLLGRGGLKQMTEDDLEDLLKVLDEQVEFLKGFKSSLGELSELRAINRLRSYAQSAIMSYWRGKDRAIVDSGYTEEKWMLGVAEHCEGCLELSGLGWVSVGELPAIGSQECVFNCKCRKEYR